MDRLSQKKFNYELLECRATCEPDEIKWENLGVSKASRICRQILIGLLAFIIILVSTWGMVAFTVESNRSSKEF